MKLYYIIIVLITLNAFADRKYQIYDTKQNKVVDVNQLAYNTTGFDVIFFGEFHDDPLIHQLQKEYLKEMYDINENITISLEMFERDVQSYMDKYLSDEIGEEEFLENSRPWKDYEEFYRPLVELAKEYEADVIASNIPRKYAGMFARGGNSSLQMLSEDEKKLIAKEMILKDDDYKTKFFLTMLGSADKIDGLTYNEENTLWLYYGAQLIKDETMAESILEHFVNNPNQQIIHFNGDFHSNSYLGTTQKLMERNPDIKVGVITPMYSDNAEITGEDLEKEGDFIIFLEDFERKDRPMNMPDMHLGENSVSQHHIKVEIFPESSQIAAQDSIVFKNPIYRKSSLKLLNSLKIEDIKCYTGEIDWQEKQLNDTYKEIIFTNTSFNKQAYGKSGIIEANNIVIKYSGEVYNKPSETNLIERHSRSAGIISDKDKEGLYLPGKSYYPATDKDMADFNAEIIIPSEYKIITSGKMSETESNGKTIFRTETEFPIDNLILVGGKYAVTSKESGGVRLNVYTYEESKNAQMYLKSLTDIYNFYTELFGEYPFESFSVVENFFSTGFGMPGYTLLGGKLMAMPWVTLSPGSLPHEFVHNWWGNSVFVDYERGNWCEALTTFCSNYYYNHLDNNEQGLIDWRKKALISIDALPEEKNYPLSEFEYQKDKFDAVIGYEKGGFLFYEIYKMMGNEHFFAALQEFAEKYKGKRATWFSLIMTFSSYAKTNELDIPVRDVFSQWLNTTDIPEISMSNIKVKRSKAKFTIEQDLNIISKVPVRFRGKKEEHTEYFTITEGTNEFEFNPGFKIREIQIDPEYEVLRKLNDWEKPYSFNRTLGKNPLIITPAKSSPDYKVSQDFVKMLNESGYSFEVKSADEVTNKDYENHSLLLLGNKNSNKVISKAIEKAPKNIVFADKIVSFSKEKQINPKESIMLMNIDHPYSKSELCTIIYYDTNDDVSSLARFFHYTGYSMVVLKIGQRGRPFFDMEIYPSGYERSELLWKK